ncbi:hypothetical protein C8J56DRAFT_925594 [Mycena floridula]|nr:hypothetical protein C8J56DRAFT_925594 [Mycena floridula]
MNPTKNHLDHPWTIQRSSKSPSSAPVNAHCSCGQTAAPLDLGHLLSRRNCRNSSRIEEIYLIGDADPFHVADSPDPVFNRLSAVLVCPSLDANRAPLRLPWLSAATNVRHLVLEDLDAEEEDFWINLPFESTQLLFLETYSVSRAFSTFSRFPNLLSSGLMCQYGDCHHLFVYKFPPTLHYLSATINCIDRECVAFDERYACNCIDKLLSGLTLPGLKGLRLEGNADFNEVCWSRGHFFEFLHRSALKEVLTSLHNIGGLDDEELVTVFRSVPSLTHLTVSGFQRKPIIGIPMLTRLANGSHSPLLLRLKFFDVQIHDTFEAVEAVIHLVRARSAFMVPLEGIAVRISEHFESMKRLEDGLGSLPGIRYIVKSVPRWGYSTSDSLTGWNQFEGFERF